MKELNSIFERHVNIGLCPGVEWKIVANGRTYNGKVGFRNIETQELVQENSIYRIWSMTKPIIGIAMMQLVQEKLINLDDPIDIFIPEFSNLKVLKNFTSSLTELVDLKNMPTIRDLFLHIAGFSYNFLADPIGKKYDEIKLFNSNNTTLEEEINLLSKIPLLFQPSTNWRYSVSMDVMGRIIEIVTKKSLQSTLQEKIFYPIGMNETSFSVPKNKINRIMSSYEFDQNFSKLMNHVFDPQKIGNYGYPYNKDKTYARGGHGLFSTPHDYSLFAQMLLTGKTADGTEILKLETIKEMTKNHLDSSFLPLEILSVGTIKVDDYVNDLDPYGWGLGFRTLIDLNKANNIGTVGEFGWAGAAATYFLVDPKYDLTAVLMTQVFNASPIIKNDFVKTIYKNLKQ